MELTLVELHLLKTLQNRHGRSWFNQIYIIKWHKYVRSSLNTNERIKKDIGSAWRGSQLVCWQCVHKLVRSHKTLELLQAVWSCLRCSVIYSHTSNHLYIGKVLGLLANPDHPEEESHLQEPNAKRKGRVSLTSYNEIQFPDLIILLKLKFKNLKYEILRSYGCISLDDVRLTFSVWKYMFLTLPRLWVIKRASERLKRDYKFVWRCIFRYKAGESRGFSRDQRLPLAASLNIVNGLK